MHKRRVVEASQVTEAGCSERLQPQNEHLPVAIGGLGARLEYY